MNPVLLKTLITLAASNNKPAKSGTVGSDAQLKNRTILYPDEAVDMREWGISGLPAMVLGAAPQTCLFVTDLTTSDDAPPDDSDDGSEGPYSDASADDTASGDKTPTASFSLTLKCPPADGSTVQARTIVWQLTVPITGHRNIQTSANSESVRAPVIKTRLRLQGIDRDVEVGLLEMPGLEQPLLIGQDTLGDKFLIRPDRPASDKKPKSPSVDLSPETAPDVKATVTTENADTKEAEDRKTADPEPSDTARADAAPAAQTQNADSPAAPAATDSNATQAPEPATPASGDTTTQNAPDDGAAGTTTPSAPTATSDDDTASANASGDEHTGAADTTEGNAPAQPIATADAQPGTSTPPADQSASQPATPCAAATPDTSAAGSENTPADPTSSPAEDTKTAPQEPSAAAPTETPAPTPDPTPDQANAQAPDQAPTTPPSDSR